MKAETLALLQKDPDKLKSMLAEIDQEISTLSNYMVNLNSLIQELKNDRKYLEDFTASPKLSRKINLSPLKSEKITGEYFFG